MNLLDALKAGHPTVAAELRPPRAELDAAEGMEAWVDTYHAVRGLTRQGTLVFLTDGAVGLPEEDNLRHLVVNLGSDAPRDRVVPFLTCKHSLEYCLAYAERARQHGFRSLVVVGGDRAAGPPRCVEHAWRLREMIRARHPDLVLGGWANPFADPVAQVEYLLAPRANVDFFLTQIVSHHHLEPVERFLDEARRRELRLPAMFGVFYYRSANLRTLAVLERFLPVPAEALAEEFAAGVSAEEVCARSIRALTERGAHHLYVSNLPIARAAGMLRGVLERAGIAQ